MKLLPLGSIVKIKDCKVCIIGYGSVDQEASSQSGYFAVQYPIGFTSLEKTLFIPLEAEMELVAEGYKTEPSAKALETLANSFQLVEKVSVEELSKINEKLKDAIETKKGSGEA